MRPRILIVEPKHLYIAEIPAFCCLQLTGSGLVDDTGWHDPVMGACQLKHGRCVQA